MTSLINKKVFLVYIVFRQMEVASTLKFTIILLKSLQIKWYLFLRIKLYLILQRQRGIGLFLILLRHLTISLRISMVHWPNKIPLLGGFPSFVLLQCYEELQQHNGVKINTSRIKVFMP